MTTEFEIRQIIDATPDEFWERLHKSEEYGHYLYVESLGFGYEPIEVDHARGITKARIIPKVPAPDALAKLFGADFSFVEDGTLGADGVYRFRILPSTLGDRINVSGEMQILPEGDDRCVRHMTFRIDARVPGLGRLVEKFVERSTRKSYIDSHAITNRYLAERPRAAGE
jgi:hypothetical protein